MGYKFGDVVTYRCTSFSNKIFYRQSTFVRQRIHSKALVVQNTYKDPARGHLVKYLTTVDLRGVVT